MWKLTLPFLVLAGLLGCSGGASIDAGKIKNNQQKHMGNSARKFKDETGVDLGTATPRPRGKFGLPTAPTDP